jgi:spore maturation protein CgeB
LREEFGARRPCAFYCFVDEQAYTPLDVPERWTINYLGTYSAGRQPALENLLLDPARALPHARFAVAGPMYPPEIDWPENVEWIDHLPPAEHPRFYCAAAFTLNVTRPEMRAMGYSPSVRLFEAAACGVPVISDRWPGIASVFTPGIEIFLADTREEVLSIIERTDDSGRRATGEAARRRVLAEHTSEYRVRQLHELVREPVGEAR